MFTFISENYLNSKPQQNDCQLEAQEVNQSLENLINFKDQEVKSDIFFEIVDSFSSSKEIITAKNTVILQIEKCILTSKINSKHLIEDKINVFSFFKELVYNYPTKIKLIICDQKSLAYTFETDILSFINDSSSLSYKIIENKIKENIQRFENFFLEIRARLSIDIQKQFQLYKKSHSELEFNILSYLESLLCNLTESNDLALFEKLINLGVNINTLTKGFSPLHIATDKLNLSLLEYLISKEANINIKDENGKTALNLAIEKKNYRLINFFRDNEADFNVIDNLGRTILHYAVFMEDHYILQQALKKQKNKDILDNNGMSPLHYACKKGNVITVKNLIQEGVNLNHINSNGESALVIAKNEGHQRITKLLLAAGIDSSHFYDWNFDNLSLNMWLSEEKHEIYTYKKNPLSYILKNNLNAKQTIIALEKIENQPHINNVWQNDISALKDCLYKNNFRSWEDLIIICNPDNNLFSIGQD